MQNQVDRKILKKMNLRLTLNTNDRESIFFDRSKESVSDSKARKFRQPLLELLS